MDATAAAEVQVAGQDIPWLLAHWAEKKPDHPVLHWDPAEGDGRSWTYAELWSDVRRLAAGLVDRGIGKDDKVLIHSENCPEMVLAWLACSTIGAVGVTTNTKSVAVEVEYFIEKAQCVAAITQPEFTDLVAEAGAKLQWTAVIGEDFEELFAADAEAWPGREVEPMLPFGIMFTSGTTNKPKAVVHTHANAIWASRTGPRNIDLGPGDRYLIYLPFFHVNAQSWSFFSVLGVGATAVLMPKWSQTRFWDVVARHGITHISLMPFVMGALMAPDKPETDLRVGVFGLIMPELDQMFGIQVVAAYGMTETVTHCITAKPYELPEYRSMGRVTPGYEFLVVDKDTGEIVPEGETGELWMRGTRGVQLFLEYFDNPEANESSFEDGWFKTGDMVARGPGGDVFYKERDKDLLKVGGENVSAREVEEAITGLPGVAQVAVVGKKHEFLDQVVVAFVITTPDAPEHAELEKGIIDHCAAHLATFKVPRAVYVVDEFPLGTLDKLLKNKLRDLADEQPAID
jgi:crotonobetaine/carnitine-CoA ligase